MFLGMGALIMMGTNVPDSRKLRHVVAFDFKPGVSLEQMEEISQDFHALEDKVPQIIEFEGGADIDFPKEGGSDAKKYTHCFIVTVKDEKDLAAYGAHPAHQAFSKSADSLLQEVMVVDYYTD